MRNRFYAMMIVLMLLLSMAGVTIQAQEAGPACHGAATFETGPTEYTFEHDGQDRFYILYIPESYDPAEPSPLVLSLHGFTANAPSQMKLTKWNDVADENGFIVAYPEGLGTETGAFKRWNAGLFPFAGQGPSATDDVGYIRELIAYLSETYCIDPARVFVNGISNGGGMSNRIACELSDQVAAIGSVAGAYSPLEGGCNPTRPVPVIAFHGTGDTVVPYEGNTGTQFDFPHVLDWAAAWAARNGCDESPMDMGRTGDTTAIRYDGCGADAEVIFYTVDDGGHTWPGEPDLPEWITGKTTLDISATRLMWDFFLAHPMPGD